jgi:hypothetical protein
VGSCCSSRGRCRSARACAARSARSASRTRWAAAVRRASTMRRARYPGLRHARGGQPLRHRAIVTPGYALDNTGVDLERRDAARLLERRLDFGVGIPRHAARGGSARACGSRRPRSSTAAIERGRPVDADAYRADFEIERARQEIWHHMACCARTDPARPCGRAAPDLLVSVQRPQGVRRRPARASRVRSSPSGSPPTPSSCASSTARRAAGRGRWWARPARRSAIRPTRSGRRRR